MPEVAGDQQVWIARLRPAPGVGLAGLLDTPLGLDVWERGPDHLVVAATEEQLAEVQRRRLATVERVATRAEYESRPGG